MTAISLLLPGELGPVTVIQRIRATLRTQDESVVEGIHTWLDTFDARLFHAGLAAAFFTSEHATWLHVTSLETGALLGRLPLEVRPRFVADLPAHPLAARISALIDIRALIPICTTTSSTRTLRILDAVEKTIAFLDIDSLEPPAADGSRTQLSVRAVRGYDKQAKTVALRLADAFDAQPTDRPLALHAFEAARWDPARQAAPVDEALDRQLPAGAGLAAILRGLHRIVEANVGGTVEAVDTEFLHDLRVAVRRARSALKLAGDVLPESVSGRLAQGLHLVGNATTPARDLDVYVLGFEPMTAGLNAQVVADLIPFRDLLVRRQAAAQQELAKYLRSRKFATFLNRWADLVDETFPPTPTAAGLRPLGDIADERIAGAWRKVYKHGLRITDASPVEDLHDLRKRSKELRYAFEMFRQLYDAHSIDQLVAELKVLQDNLGSLHDSHFQRTAVAEYAAELAESGARVGTVVAMGALMQDLTLREVSAREDFAKTFARFARPANRRRVKTLVGGDR